MRQQWNNENHSTPIPNQDWNYLEKNPFIPVYFFLSLSVLFIFYSPNSIESYIKLWQIKSIKWFQITSKDIQTNWWTSQAVKLFAIISQSMICARFAEKLLKIKTDECFFVLLDLANFNMHSESIWLKFRNINYIFLQSHFWHSLNFIDWLLPLHRIFTHKLWVIIPNYYAICCIKNFLFLAQVRIRCKSFVD